MKIKDAVYNFATKNKEGFIQDEIDEILKLFPNINLQEFYDSMIGVTCIADKDNNTIIYHCDIEYALHNALRKNKINPIQFD
jgi:GTP1/Obg family GTP-binding protein